MRHQSELLVSGFGRPVMYLGRIPRPEGWLHMYEMNTVHFAIPNLSVVVDFTVCGVIQNLYVFSHRLLNKFTAHGPLVQKCQHHNGLQHHTKLK